MKPLVENSIELSAGYAPTTPISFDLAGRAHGLGPHCAARDLHFAPRTRIFFEGDESESILQIIAGEVMLYKLLPDGRRQVVELLGAGDVFGFSPADAEIERAASCAALCAARACDAPGAEISDGAHGELPHAPRSRPRGACLPRPVRRR